MECLGICGCYYTIGMLGYVLWFCGMVPPRKNIISGRGLDKGQSTLCYIHQWPISYFGGDELGSFCGRYLYWVSHWYGTALWGSRSVTTDVNVEHNYASKWHYSFGAAKSVILVFWESATSRKTLRQSCCWFINQEAIREGDSAKHLGVTFSVTSSTLNHTLKSVVTAWGAFFALTPYGVRFGCSHPKTSLQLYYSYVHPILTFGLHVVNITISELLNLERAQLTIQRIILGVPTRTATSAIHAVLGSLPVNLQVKYMQLSFLHSLLSLPSDSTQRRLLNAKLQTRSFVSTRATTISSNTYCNIHCIW
jgi:hypothetical protein